MIRQMNTKLFTQLMNELTPAPVLAMLLSSMAHESWLIRCQAVNLLSLALLKYPQHTFDYARIVRTLALVLEDPQEKVPT